jgi:acetyl-CoA acetyltransferase
MATPAVYIAGVGAAISSDPSTAALDKEIVSAVTKALLDAGVTYGDVDSSIACFLGNEGLKVPKSSLDTFGKTGAPVSEVECYAGLHTASQFLKSGHSNCVLMVGFDKVYDLQMTVLSNVNSNGRRRRNKHQAMRE